MHISESSDEEADEELMQAELRASDAGDVESGSPTKEKQDDPSKPHVDEIVPVYRRDCHEEVCFLVGSSKLYRHFFIFQ